MGTSKEIIEVLEYLCGKFGIVIDWNNENLLPYVQGLAEKIVKYKVASAWIWIAVGVLMFLFSAILLTIFYKASTDGVEVISFMCMCALLIIGVPLIIYNVFLLAKCAYFPDMAIYEYAKELISSGGR